MASSPSSSSPTTTPKSLQRLLHDAFTPYITNGKTKPDCCNLFRPIFGSERALLECSSTLFHPTTVEKLEASEPDVTTAQRILDVLAYQRRDVERGMSEILPSSPYEGLEYREKLKECDRLGSEIKEADRQRSLLKIYETNKSDYDRLSVLLPRLQIEAERAGEEKRSKEHQLHRKRLRRDVLEEEASERELRREERAERRNRREMDGIDTRPLMDPPDPRRPAAVGRGRVVRRIREVEIPDLMADIQELETDILALERVLTEFRKTRDRVTELNDYLARTVPPTLDESQEKNNIRRMRMLRTSLQDRSPRMFTHLLRDKPEGYVKHEKDFDEFYELIDSGVCPCGMPFSEHLVLITQFPKESDQLEARLTRFAEAHAEVDQESN